MVVVVQGNRVRMLLGHQHGVISLAWTASGQLLSGSWDGTAKVSQTASTNGEGGEVRGVVLVRDLRGWFCACGAAGVGCGEGRVCGHAGGARERCRGARCVGDDAIAQKGLVPRRSLGAGKLRRHRVVFLVGVWLLPASSSGLPNGVIATGSTGREQAGQIVDVQIRLWKDGRTVKTIKDHQGKLLTCCCFASRLGSFMGILT